MKHDPIQHVRVIDSHTGGEPTRVVVAGFPPLSGTTPAGMRSDFIARHDAFRSAVVNEPRGSDVLVGAVLVPPTDPTCVTGVVFFNNVGALNMCGHGTIGVVVTLAHLGRIGPGVHRIETPVGVVSAELHADGHGVSFENVPCRRFRKGVQVDVPGHGTVSGDIAWGGNWFFLCADHGLPLVLGEVERLTDFTWNLREELARRGLAGEDGGEIDHIELFGPPATPAVDARSFVLCPGRAYDRSPCGTGTSAKLACLVEDGKLAEGETWRQESITGSIFEGSVRIEGGAIIPRITGHAWVNGEATLVLDPSDPLCWGIRR